MKICQLLHVGHLGEVKSERAAESNKKSKIARYAKQMLKVKLMSLRLN